MKKIITFLLVVLFTTYTSAQLKRIKGNGNITTITRTVSDYDKIGVAGSFDVELIEASEGDITIEGEDNLLRYIITEVDGKELKIKWKRGIRIRTSKKIKITVPFKDINEIALAGSGDITSNATITADEFKINLAGSGDIDLKLKVVKLKSAISGSGDLSLRGETINFDCAVSGSADVDADDLITDNSTIRVSGSADVSIHVNQVLDAVVSGSGDISYKGNPKKNISKVSGSGSVRSL
ncbi:DUF2807 domain-containing protein [Aureibaculum marinum]|uniref:DUF2807 domain-containing protein n=1 Tax=Aureibaculum marinum TaxID=2487930 RepID=A0A3N4NX10_9FLAO|nr:head GIN domain-containing protein [Aureibaculum marinum]RPD98788.1 DUF2807 domain-containing protein [Aureibaculum marinum]